MYRVIKRNKRLWIENRAGELIYSPPDFIRLHGRQEMQQLAEDMLTMSKIAAIQKFELKVSP